MNAIGILRPVVARLPAACIALCLSGCSLLTVRPGASAPLQPAGEVPRDERAARSTAVALIDRQTATRPADQIAPEKRAVLVAALTENLGAAPAEIAADAVQQERQADSLIRLLAEAAERRRATPPGGKLAILDQWLRDGTAALLALGLGGALAVTGVVAWGIGKKGVGTGLGLAGAFFAGLGFVVRAWPTVERLLTAVVWLALGVAVIALLILLWRSRQALAEWRKRFAAVVTSVEPAIQAAPESAQREVAAAQEMDPEMHAAVREARGKTA
jgi:hypothetical protein